MKRLMILFYCMLLVCAGNSIQSQTKPFVPRANNEGGIGNQYPSPLHWGFGYFRGLYADTLYGTYLVLTNTPWTSMGYLTSYTETDPIYSAWNKSSGISITKSQVSDFPTLATVATSGSYSDLSNKPTIPAAQVNSDWNSSSGLSQILNKPTIPTVPSLIDSLNWNKYNQWDGGSTGLTATTGRTSLGLNNGAMLDTNEFAAKFPKNADTTTLHNEIIGRELALGSPSVSGYVLSSTTGGVRSWIVLPIYQTAYTNLTTFGSLSNSTGYLYNNGSGTLSYGTPTITETDPVVKAISGIVKSNGTTISAAVAGTDYVAVGGALGTPTSGTLTNCTFPTLNQNTSGTAANLSGTPALPNGTTATTQAKGDNSTKIATTAYMQLYAQPLYATPTALTAGSTVTWTPVLGTNIYTLTPAQTETINMGTIPSGCVGSYITLVITTSGTTAYTLTFGTNIKSQSTLSTGTTTAKTFVINYLIYSTTGVYEMSRTTAE